MAYDETPLPLRVRSSDDIVEIIRQFLPDAVGALATSSASRPEKDPCAKIMQTEFVVSLLFRLRGVYTEVHVEMPCNVQVIDRCTGEAYVAAQEAVLPQLESVVAFFKRSDRHATTDCDSSVLRCGRALAGRGPQRLLNHGFCRIHRIGAIAGKGVERL